MTFKVVGSYDDGDSKVVEVLVEVEGAEGPSEDSRTFHWFGAERYKVSSGGKPVPKTGADYKADIAGRLRVDDSPKG